MTTRQKRGDLPLSPMLERVLLSGVDAPKVVVDHDECEANAVCVGIAPEIFDLDDDEQLHILIEQPEGDLLTRAREAVDSCPKRALFLREAGQ
jgi:ferredoxin